MNASAASARVSSLLTPSSDLGGTPQARARPPPGGGDDSRACSRYDGSTVTGHLFYDDYSEGVHPALLDALVRCNDDQQPGYGRDAHSELAAERIAAHFQRPVDVHFVTGGTQANQICLAAMLRPHQGVIAPLSGHIAIHEAGAIEATGHKVLTVSSPDGKLTPRLIDEALTLHEGEHTVMPRAVFLSQATESGTVYTRSELNVVAQHARASGLYVYLDGARLAMALASPEADMTLADIADAGVDMLYLGGTKNGALCGEAIVIVNRVLGEGFRYQMKQRGALLAKGRLLGVQFTRFFGEDGLWLSLGARANAQARRLADGLESLGVELQHPPAVNQVFAILSSRVAEALSAEWGFYVWKRLPHGRVLVRLVCSWATPDDAIESLVDRLRGLL
jgi:threonine aldolase